MWGGLFGCGGGGGAIGLGGGDEAAVRGWGGGACSWVSDVLAWVHEANLWGTGTRADTGPGQGVSASPWGAGGGGLWRGTAEVRARGLACGGLVP